MNENLNFIEEIKQTERDNYSKFLNILNLKITKYWAGSETIAKNIKEKKLEASSFRKAIYLIVLLLLSIYLINAGIKIHEIGILGRTIAIIFGIALALYVVNQLYIDEELKYSILMNDKEIQIDNKIFLWEDIYETAILSITEFGMKGTRDFLIIAMKDMKTYEKFDLRNLTLTYSRSKLSKYIEYFKHYEINILHTT
jgi:hypothetical protein